MNFSEQRLSIEEARQTDIVNYLAKLGYEPSKLKGNDYWYSSLLRNEITPSFKVKRKLNRWYDYGLGKGGNIIDFAILYINCTIGNFLNQLSGNFSFQKPFISLEQNLPNLNKENKICILQSKPISSLLLLRYLHKRKIPIDIAERYCVEVIYECNDKKYFAIGFKNNSGGYELRNPYFKGSSSPKDITIFDNCAKEATVFEGFIDFLSFMAIHKNQSQNRSDFVILNSVSFFEKARPFMEQHDSIRLYLDHDTAGQNCSNYALSLNKNYTDEGCLYQNHKDLNDWLVNVGKTQKKTLRLKL